MYGGTLFMPNHIVDVYKSLERRMRQEIASIPEKWIMGASVAELASGISEKYLPECRVLSDGVSCDEAAFTPDGHRGAVTVYVPFSGDPTLFPCSGARRP